MTARRARRSQGAEEPHGGPGIEMVYDLTHQDGRRPNLSRRVARPGAGDRAGHSRPMGQRRCTRLRSSPTGTSRSPRRSAPSGARRPGDRRAGPDVEQGNRYSARHTIERAGQPEADRGRCRSAPSCRRSSRRSGAWPPSSAPTSPDPTDGSAGAAAVRFGLGRALDGMAARKNNGFPARHRRPAGRSPGRRAAAGPSGADCDWCRVGLERSPWQRPLAIGRSAMRGRLRRPPPVGDKSVDVVLVESGSYTISITGSAVRSSAPATACAARCHRHRLRAGNARATRFLGRRRGLSGSIRSPWPMEMTSIRRGITTSAAARAARQSRSRGRGDAETRLFARRRLAPG